MHGVRTVTSPAPNAIGTRTSTLPAYSRRDSLRINSRRRLRLDLCADLLLAPPAPARAGRRLLRRGQILGQCECDLVQFSQLLARLVDQLVRARRVALCRGEQRGADRERNLLGRLDEL